MANAQPNGRATVPTQFSHVDSRSNGNAYNSVNVPALPRKWTGRVL